MGELFKQMAGVHCGEFELHRNRASAPRDTVPQILPLRMLPPPFALPAISVSLFWHERTQHSALHRWFRKAISNVAAEI
jgi:DNA-binding transcriptional LysR family regulator